MANILDSHRLPRLLGTRHTAAEGAPVAPVGPIAGVVYTVYLIVVMPLIFGATAQLSTSTIYEYMGVAAVFGAVLLTPGPTLMRVRVAPSALLFLTWIGCSLLWTVDVAKTQFAIREEFPTIMAVVVAASVLPIGTVARAVVRGFQLGVAVTAVAIAVDPGAREQVGDNGELAEAWSGWFHSENEMAMFLVLALAGVLIIERRGWSQRISIVAIAVLIVGSTSTTALIAAMLVFIGIAWHRSLQRVGQGRTAAFVVTSLAGTLVAVVASLGSAAWILQLFGKDLTFTGRTRIWEAAIHAIEDRPWLGFGYDALFQPDGIVTADIWREIGFPASHAHNGALDSVLDVGVIGFGLLFMLYVASLATTLRSTRHDPIAVWLATILLTQLLVSVGEPSFSGPWISLLILIRVLSVRVADEHDPRRAHRRSQITAKPQVYAVRSS